ncbi:hypothetical protein BC939DRAFT_513724 [Gamsiella multidivaricata]|uniref:uncharacterized protein n=1 Tax=Gamsiella multidivaricata TaxID=101098 RepID=UPI00221FED49|nr:uncharacterized protein BC939DRAFT_513724 [Gamsiella multidivaricata]KAI7827139.1 hypothetical protein BC939DRAFT_513724 [Gamsiella multidivaricata]
MLFTTRRIASWVVRQKVKPVLWKRQRSLQQQQQQQQQQQKQKQCRDTDLRTKANTNTSASSETNVTSHLLHSVPTTRITDTAIENTTEASREHDVRTTPKDGETGAGMGPSRGVQPRVVHFSRMDDVLREYDAARRGDCQASANGQDPLSESIPVPAQAYSADEEAVNDDEGADVDWTERYIELQINYKDILGALHFTLSRNIHQLLLDHRHAVRQLQGQMFRVIAGMEPLLSDVVYDMVIPKMTRDLESQRRCCKGVGRALRKELKGEMLTLRTAENDFGQIQQEEAVEEEERDNEQVDENWTMFGWSPQQCPFASPYEASVARNRILAEKNEGKGEQGAEQPQGGGSGPPHSINTARHHASSRASALDSSSYTCSNIGTQSQRRTRNPAATRSGPSLAPSITPANSRSPSCHTGTSRSRARTHNASHNLSHGSNSNSRRDRRRDKRYGAVIATSSTSGTAPQAVIKHVTNFFQGGTHHHYGTTPCRGHERHRRNIYGGPINDTHNDSDSDDDDDLQRHLRSYPRRPKTSRGRYSEEYASDDSIEPSYQDPRVQNLGRSHASAHALVNPLNKDNAGSEHDPFTIDLNPNNHLISSLPSATRPSDSGSGSSDEGRGAQNTLHHKSPTADDYENWPLVFREDLARAQQDHIPEHETSDEDPLYSSTPSSGGANLTNPPREWIRQSHVRETTLILEGRRSEATEVRRNRVALREKSFALVTGVAGAEFGTFGQVTEQGEKSISAMVSEAESGACRQGKKKKKNEKSFKARLRLGRIRGGLLDHKRSGIRRKTHRLKLWSTLGLLRRRDPRSNKVRK